MLQSSSVTSIGDVAFFECSNLVSVVIPNSVTSIGSRVFSYCLSLETITVAEGNTKYHSRGNCLIETETKTLIAGCKISVIPTDGSVTSIDFAAFYGCGSLVSVAIPSSVTSIGQYAFYDCGSLESVVIPNGVTRIDNDTFYNCGGLKNVVIPSSVTSIADNAFAFCRNLETLTIEEGNVSYRSVGNCIINTKTKTLLRGCKNSVIPTDGSVTVIGSNAFNGCSGLVKAVIPASITKIETGAFSYCNDLETFVVEEGNTMYKNAGDCLIEIKTKKLVVGCKNSVIPNDGSVTTIGAYGFYGCSGLVTLEIPSSIKTISRYSFVGCKDLVSVTMQDGVTRVESMAFYSCKNLKSVEFSASVTDISNQAFSECGGLEKLTVKEGNNTYHSAGNCIIHTAKKELVVGCKNSVIPTDGSVTSIGMLAFKGRKDLKSIDIPSSVTNIGGSAFANSGLTNVVISSSVTELGNYAFSGCEDLESVVIGKGVTKIGSTAFEQCGKLVKIEYQGTISEWKAIEKESNWDRKTGEYTVTCTDGTLSKADA